MRKLFVIPLLLLVLVLSACGSGGFKADHTYKLDPFEFTNQNNEKVSLDDLKGEVWLAQFVFTNCTSICQPMMFNMATLQDQMIKEGIEDYKIVSFSVDPENDSPEVLKEYLDVFAADPDDEIGWDASKWEMLTGYPIKEIADIANKSFKTVVIQIPGEDQITHGNKFYLVNQKGEVVKTYTGAKTPDSEADVPYDTIIKDMKQLIKEGV